MRLVRRDAVALLLVALICGLATALPPFGQVHGWSIDILTALRWQMFGARRDAASAPVAVIAIDEETHNTPPFDHSPTPTWTTEVGRVLSAVLDGGAKVAGFDVVFATSIEQSEIPFGDDILGAKLRGFDRPFLRSLATGAAAGKVVLGEVLRDDGAIGPAAGQRIAVRQQQNIRPLNVYFDPDEIFRRVPLTFAGKQGPIPSMALELAARAQQAAPVFAKDGSVTLAGYYIPSAVMNTLTLNFDGGAADIQTYSLADLRACVERGDKEFFRSQFEGKIVIFGTLLEAEDRKLTSKRFVTGIDRASAPRCTLPPAPPSPAKFSRSTIAGVYIHATAVNNLIARDALVELGRVPTIAIAIGFALLAAAAARRLAPAFAALAFVGMMAIWTLGATLAFSKTLVLPLSEPFAAGLAALVMITAYRLVVTDRGQRLLRKSFALYLAPQVIDQMLHSNKLPALGGETRNVTVFFSDLAGFSSIAEQMTPTELVEFMNEYLSAMTDIIESQGGYVEKYIADSIVAVFGAPVDDADHARHAAQAALLCRIRLEELNENSAAFRGHKVAHRMGLNSGEALVGNIGSRRRFNYSVMSDAVNVASRLEGANKYYGTTIIASETTVAATGATFAWRELDATRVKGRITPVKICELLAESGQETPEQREAASAYAQGLAHWRAREFDAAAASFSRVAEFDPPSALFLQRSCEFAKQPPDAGWEPVSALDSK
ncbi:MAG TPA: adenylate/guanylate cyclase domain-containing protein [Bradyrhizobium sp.]|jgi:class 3 adenylate cyclase|nr:adenylate/guanylate cyclase domain-containing protein [Bradyrhizobium sp.]